MQNQAYTAALLGGKGNTIYYRVVSPVTIACYNMPMVTHTSQETDCWIMNKLHNPNEFKHCDSENGIDYNMWVLVSKAISNWNGHSFPALKLENSNCADGPCHLIF